MNTTLPTNILLFY